MSSSKRGYQPQEPTPAVTRAQARRQEQATARQQIQRTTRQERGAIQQQNRQELSGPPVQKKSNRKSSLSFGDIESQDNQSYSDNTDTETVRENLSNVNLSQTHNMSEAEGAAAAALTTALNEHMVPVLDALHRKIQITPIMQAPKGSIALFDGELPSNFYSWIKLFESIGSTDIGWSDSEKKRRIGGYLISHKTRTQNLSRFTRRTEGLGRHSREHMERLEKSSGKGNHHRSDEDVSQARTPLQKTSSI